jgi:predicted methyltransferase
MRTFVTAFVLALVAAVPSVGDAQGNLQAILADTARPQADRDQDASRKPAEVLEFLGIGTGDRVADLLSGGGYWTRILVPLVGPQGRVYAGNNPFYQRFYAEAFDALLKEPRFANVVRVDGPVDELALPKDGSLDAVLLVLAYHDLFLIDEDRAAMNRAIFAALKPGGVFAIIDHAAAAGSGTSAAESLHRIDQAVVVEEVRTAGFELGGEADFLRNASDPRTASVFDPSIMGKTDRFVLRFVKPR